jgi:hypothetical protein
LNRRVLGFLSSGTAALLGGGLLLAALPAASQQAASQPAATEATTPQAAAVKICTSCHGMEMVTDTPRDIDAWHDTVQKMIDRGARGTPDEFDLVRDFLYQNVTPVDVNHADPDMLLAVLHAPQAAVDAIVTRRQTRPFKDLSDLETVPGLDRALLESKKRMIFFQ